MRLRVIEPALAVDTTKIRCECGNSALTTKHHVVARSALRRCS